MQKHKFCQNLKLPCAVVTFQRADVTLKIRSKSRKSNQLLGPPGVLVIWGEWLFIFRDLRSNGNYFRGAGEQAHSFGDLGSPAKKQKKIKAKAPFCLIFKKIFCFPDPPFKF